MSIMHHELWLWLLTAWLSIGLPTTYHTCEAQGKGSGIRCSQHYQRGIIAPWAKKNVKKAANVTDWIFWGNLKSCKSTSLFKCSLNFFWVHFEWESVHLRLPGGNTVNTENFCSKLCKGTRMSPLGLTPWFCLLELHLYQEGHLCGMPLLQIINEVMNQKDALGFTSRATSSKTPPNCIHKNSCIQEHTPIWNI